MAPPIPALDPTPATGLRCRGTVGPSPQDCGHGGVPEGGTKIHNDYVLVLKKIKKEVEDNTQRKTRKRRKPGFQVIDMFQKLILFNVYSQQLDFVSLSL